MGREESSHLNGIFLNKGEEEKSWRRKSWEEEGNLPISRGQVSNSLQPSFACMHAWISEEEGRGRMESGVCWWGKEKEGEKVILFY